MVTIIDDAVVRDGAKERVIWSTVARVCLRAFDHDVLLAVDTATTNAETALVAWETWEQAQNTANATDTANANANASAGPTNGFRGGAGPTGILRHVQSTAISLAKSQISAV